MKINYGGSLFFLCQKLFEVSAEFVDNVLNTFWLCYAM